METKQTAVDWIEEQIKLKMMGLSTNQNIFEQAKQMEKEQIIQFADEYADAVMGGCINRAEQYYNETYGKQDK